MYNALARAHTYLRPPLKGVMLTCTVRLALCDHGQDQDLAAGFCDWIASIACTFLSLGKGGRPGGRDKSRGSASDTNFERRDMHEEVPPLMKRPATFTVETRKEAMTHDANLKALAAAASGAGSTDINLDGM